jgi:hypothetical protein
MFFAVTDISYCEDEQQCQPDVIVFFGDGFQSTEQRPVHEYTADGSYTVSLIAMTSSTVTVNGFTWSFEDRTSGCCHPSSAAAHAAFIAAP